MNSTHCSFTYQRTTGDYRRGDHCINAPIAGQTFCETHRTFNQAQQDNQCAFVYGDTRRCDKRVTTEHGFCRLHRNRTHQIGMEKDATISRIIALVLNEFINEPKYLAARCILEESHLIQIPEHSCGLRVPCRHCGALMFIGERTAGTIADPIFTKCCNNGSLCVLQPWPQVPLELSNL